MSSEDNSHGPKSQNQMDRSTMDINIPNVTIFKDDNTNNINNTDNNNMNTNDNKNDKQSDTNNEDHDKINMTNELNDGNSHMSHIPQLQDKIINTTSTMKSKSRSNSDLNSVNNQLPISSLRDKLSRNPSSTSISESTKTKMKLKLQLSQQLQTMSSLQITPVLLSPRGTPNTSPGFNPDGYPNNFDNSVFFTNVTTPSPAIQQEQQQQEQQQQQLNSILDESIKDSTSNMKLIAPKKPSSYLEARSPTDLNPTNIFKSPLENNSSSLATVPSSITEKSSASSSNSKSKSKLHLQTKIHRMSSASNAPITSSTKSPRSPLNKFKSRNIAYQLLPEPVRPQTSILKSNINTKFSQQYQQQEKMYLTGITKYKDRFRNTTDDYYDKSIIPDEVEPNNESNYNIPSNDTTEFNKISCIDSEIFANNEDSEYTHITDKDREYEALKALAQQIGSDLLNDEFGTISEYSLDSNLLLELLNRNDEIKLKDINANGIILERLEWQSMLQTVLTGDVVTGEKTKLVKPLTELEGENLLHVGYKEDFWIGIRAKLFGRTEEEQKRMVLYHRGLVDETFEEILNFKLELPLDGIDLSYFDKVKFASEKVNDLLDKYERCQELWRTQKEMETDKPQCATPEFVSIIDCLVAWTSVTDAVARESDVLKKWVGNDDLDILTASNVSDDIILTPNNNSGNNEIFKDNRPFVERILKEKDIENLFNKRLFTTFSHWTIKAKTSYLEYHKYFEQLGLPSYLDNLFVLTNFPSKLMKEIIKTRLAYAKKLKNPTMMMIDQTLDDLKMYLRLALEIRISMLEYCAPVEGWISFPDYQDPEFDDTIIQCVIHYMYLLNRKMLFSPKGLKSFRTFKEPEELEKEWEFLQNMGFYINDISVEFSIQMTSLFLKLLNRLYLFLQNQIQGPPSDGYRLDSQRLISWYTSSIENFGQMRRKFVRLEINLFQYYQNSVLFKILPQKTQKFFTLLKESNHTLYHNPKIAEDGIYIFVSESLVDRPYDVKCLLKNTYLGVNFANIPKKHIDVIQSYHPSSTINYYDSEYNDEDSTIMPLDYVIVIVPPKALMWDGAVMPFTDIDSLEIGELTRGNAMFLMSGGPKCNVLDNFDIFKQYVSDTIGTNTKLCCSTPKLEEYFQTSIKLFSKITCLVIDSSSNTRNLCRGVGSCQELVNNIFIFSRDVGRDSIRNSAIAVDLLSGRSTIILRMINLAIEWLTFIVDDCSPTDPKTFRWCVSALEFAMDVTRGFNILTLDAEKFYRLKDKVAGCMTLLIAHFDIMGARAKELQRTRMQSYVSQKDIYTLDDESLGSLRKHIMLQIGQIEAERRQLQVEQRSVGRVLDDTDMENQLLTYLASSFSSVSIRWQKGKFLGGGTFGSVFAGINLDTGGAMAVKEIRFQDRQSIKTIVPAIKGEMSVLELLSHPNIVQFFGVEVHRDRVYIFMEYCSGGSLAGLLEYGRIEDEIVIQLYTLQMLEGLAYLHQFGIVHRDVKPDNILLDHMGVIKFVDFGSAKVIAIPNSGSNNSGGGQSSTTLNGLSTNNSNSNSNGSIANNNNNSGNHNSNNGENSSNNESSFSEGENFNSPNGSPNNISGSNHLNISVTSINGSEVHSPIEYIRSTTSTISSTLSLNEIVANAHNFNNTNSSMNQNYNKSTTSNSNLCNSNLINTLSSMSTSSISAYTGPTNNNNNNNNFTTVNNSLNTTNNINGHVNGTIVESLIESKKSHVLTGTPMYMSPETIKGDNMGKFGAMDIWSLGCCVLEMATGRRPWSNLDNEFAVMYHIAAGHLPQFPTKNELSELGQEFLAKCLTIDPTKRASAVELLQDPWIQAIRNEAFSDNGFNVNDSINTE